MKTVLTLTVGLHLLLGSITLAGVGIVEPLTEVNMTPLVVMSLATEDTKTSAPECGAEEKTVVSTPGMKSSCPTAQCIAEHDDDTHIERTSLVFRSPEAPAAILAKVPSVTDHTTLFENFRNEASASITLAFHLGNLILRE